MSDISDWLAAWEETINARDYQAARLLFADDVVAFGSLAGHMSGLDELEQRQWRAIWENTRSFRFDPPIVVKQTADLVVLACRWRSEGMLPEGGWYDRSGRCTLVLGHTASGWRCAHSHFSMDPGIPPRRI